MLNRNRTNSRAGDAGVTGPEPAPRLGERRRRRDDTAAALGFLAPSIVTFLLFVLAPTIGVFVLSFYDLSLIHISEPTRPY